MYMRPILSVLLLLIIFSFNTKTKEYSHIRIVAAEHHLLQYNDNGSAKGPTVEITKDLLKAINVEAKIDFMPWPRAYDIALKNKNTVVLSMIRTPEREKYFHWIGIVSELSRVFISLKNKPENLITDVNQAKSKLIAVTRNSNSYNELIDKGFTEKENIYVVASPEVAFKLLLNGKVDLVYHDPNSVLKFISKTASTQQINFNPIISADRRASYIAININSNKNLVKKLKSAMKEYQKTEQYRYYLQKRG